MFKSLLGIATVAAVLTQAAELPTFAQGAEEAALERAMRRWERHAATAPTGTRAIVERRGTFRVRGNVTVKGEADACTCSATYSHSNADFDFFSNTGTAGVRRGKCSIDVPFRWARADATRPVSGSLNVLCQPDAAAAARQEGADVYSLFQDLFPGPLTDGVNRVPPVQVDISDIRLKRDIVAVGRLANGLKLYRYRYLWDGTEYVGVMAQEVAEVMPEAVVRGADGFLRVDYAKLETRLMTFDAWSSRRASVAKAQ